MLREYDIFERVDGELIWRASVPGHEPALERMKELAAKSQHEFVLMHLATKAIIATITYNSNAS